MFRDILTPRFAALVAATFAVILAFGYGRDAGWLIDARGHPHSIEFTGVRAAGELMALGQPSAAYDWKVHKARQMSITRQTDEGYYPWPYPPPYLLVAQALALGPYVLSFLAWIAVTLALQVWAATRVAGTSRVIPWILGTPPTFINAYVAHTGFLVASLMGGALAVLETSPVIAGILFGCLSFKPQLGLLVPIALIAGGYWRTIGAATATIACIVLATLPIVGVDAWTAFATQLDRVTQIFRNNNTELRMLISVYGVGRVLGLSHSAALIPQVAIALSLAIGIAILWRSHANFNIKAAGLIVASLLASPYLYVYDLPLLTMAAVFLWRHSEARGFDDVETITLLLTATLIISYQAVPFPTGFVANILVAGLVARRWHAARITAPTTVPTSEPIKIPVPA